MFTILKSVLVLFRSAASQASFWSSLPLVRASYFLRERQRERARFPRRWLTPKQVISLDLDLIGDDDLTKLDRPLLDLLVSRRDHIKATSTTISLINLSLSLFLVANYFKLGTDMSVFGISIKNSPGVAEALLMITATLSLYIISLQGNVAVIEAAIDHLVSKVFPRGTLNIMRAALLTEGTMGIYFPLNIPHIIFTNFRRRLAVILACFIIILSAFAIIFILGINFLLLFDIWEKSSFGFYSKLSVIYVTICGLFSFALIFMERLPNPYVDYTLLQQIQIAEQLNPEHAAELRRQAYRASVEDRIDLESRGFIKRTDDRA